MIKKLLLGIVIAKSLIFAGEINIAAAADLKFALSDIVKVYEAANKSEVVKTTFGASGKLVVQITEGAPFDLFFAADTSFPEKLKANGMAVGEIKPYAVGRVVLLTKKGSGVDVSHGLNILTSDKVKKIAIANPDVAPYGRAAVEAMKSGGVYEKIESKIVKGENVQQAATYGLTGSADVALVAHSLTLQPAIAKDIDSFLIDQKYHKKMVQAYVMTKKGADNPSAKKFLNFFESKEGDAVMKKYGFTLE
jgi:molybdate transport system substrate-binding protein